MASPTPTTGLSTAAVVSIPVATVTLSLAGVNTYDIIPTLKDVGGNVQTSTSLTLTAAGTASAGVTAYTGTITGGGSNAFVGYEFVIAGFVTAANNGTYVCTASSSTVLTLDNAAGASETHAGTATFEGTLPYAFVSRNPAFATVSTSGIVTGVLQGNAVVEVAYPVFNNTLGNGPDGTPVEKIYAELLVNVTP